MQTQGAELINSAHTLNVHIHHSVHSVQQTINSKNAELHHNVSQHNSVPAVLLH